MRKYYINCYGQLPHRLGEDGRLFSIDSDRSEQAALESIRSIELRPQSSGAIGK
ncbi:MAG: hypothetical protein ACRC62_36765 [Microcoleus sp.]